MHKANVQHMLWIGYVFSVSRPLSVSLSLSLSLYLSLSLLQNSPLKSTGVIQRIRNRSFRGHNSCWCDAWGLVELLSVWRYSSDVDILVPREFGVLTESYQR